MSDLNLAATVTGGGTNASVNNPTNVKDGNGGTFSQGPSGATGASPVEQYWVSDLGAAAWVAGFTVKFVNGDLSNWLNAAVGVGGAISARFQSSPDGSTWTSRSTTLAGDDGLSPRTMSWTFAAAVNARYWRIFKEGKYGNNFFDGLDIYTWAIDSGSAPAVSSSQSGYLG